MNHDTYATLAAGYALGALDGEDRVVFETHLAEGCRECSDALRDAEETLGWGVRSGERGNNR